MTSTQAAPAATLTVGACAVRLLGTVHGFAPDGDRVQAAFAAFRPTAVALGVPPEDLGHLETLHAAAGPAAGAAPVELPEPDEVTARFLELLARFGPTKVPPPDLEAAYRLAKDAGLPVAAIDLDDAAYTTSYTQRVKLRHVVQQNLRNRRLAKMEFTAATDAYDLAGKWDAELRQVKPIDALEAEREAHMAQRIVEESGRTGRLLAILPSARFPGVVAALRPKAVAQAVAS